MLCYNRRCRDRFVVGYFHFQYPQIKDKNLNNLCNLRMVFIADRPVSGSTLVFTPFSAPAIIEDDTFRL